MVEAINVQKRRQLREFVMHSGLVGNADGMSLAQLLISRSVSCSVAGTIWPSVMA